MHFYKSLPEFYDEYSRHLADESSLIYVSKYVKDKDIFFAKTTDNGVHMCSKDHELIIINDTLGVFAEVIEFFSNE